MTNADVPDINVGDMISRQAAIDAFKKELTVGESKGNYVTICSAVGYEGAKQILERLPSAQQWIPCSERLPVDDDYRESMECLDGCVWYFTDKGSMGLGYYYYSTKAWSTLRDLKPDGKVIAWMPLPEPYK